MYHKIRQVHGLNVTRDQVYAAITDVDPDGLENRKPILQKNKKKSTFSSVDPNWVLSMGGWMYEHSQSKITVYCGLDILVFSVTPNFVITIRLCNS